MNNEVKTENKIVAKIDSKPVSVTIKAIEKAKKDIIPLTEIAEILKHLASNIELRNSIQEDSHIRIYGSGKYQVAAQCCREYLKVIGMDFKQARKNRRGSVQREIVEMILWLESQKTIR